MPDFDRENIQAHELLYRAILTKNRNWWQDKANRPTSAIFKCSEAVGAVSVDRDGGRTLEVIKRNFIKRFNDERQGLLYLRVQCCIDLEVKVTPDLESENIYHALLTNLNPDQMRITDSKAKKLAMNAVVVKRPEFENTAS